MSAARNAKQVIVMRKDLGMRKGKMVAQGAHASIAWLTSRLRIVPDRLSTERHVHLMPYETAWIEGIFTKVCVGVSSEDELLAVHGRARAAGLNAYLITDNGLTEFHGVATNTCCAVGPNWVDEVDVVTGELGLL